MLEMILGKFRRACDAPNVYIESNTTLMGLHMKLLSTAELKIYHE